MEVLQNLLNNIMAFFNSTYMFVLSVCGIAGISVGLIVNRDNKAAQKKLLSWLIAIIVLNGLGYLITAFFNVKTTVSNWYFFDFKNSGNFTK